MFATSDEASAQGLGVSGNLITRSDGSRGLQVLAIQRNSLADRLGLRAGDTILSINNFPPGDAAANQLAIARGRGGLAVQIDRLGQRVTLGNANRVLPPLLGDGTDPGWSAMRPGPGYRPDGPDLQIDLQVASTLNGNRVVVSRVTRGGLGDRRGLRVGDVIDSINGIRVSSMELAQRAYVYRNGQIVLRVIQQGVPKEIRFVRKPGNRPERPGQRPNRIDRPLKLKTFRNNNGLVVLNGEPDGLGHELGIAKRGLIIRSINGSPIRTPGDLARVDEAILAGSVAQLTIEIERPGNQRDVIRYPRR